MDKAKEIGGGLLLPPEFNRQSSGLCVLRIVNSLFQPPQFCSNANSCMSNCAKLSGDRPAILALLLPLGTLTVTLSSITAQLQQPYGVPSIFQSIGWRYAMFKPPLWPAFRAGG